MQHFRTILNIENQVFQAYYKVTTKGTKENPKTNIKQEEKDMFFAGVAVGTLLFGAGFLTYYLCKK